MTRRIQVSQYGQNFQHVSAGPQPIFGLAVDLRGLGAARMKHAGKPGGEAMKCVESLFLKCTFRSANISASLSDASATPVYHLV